MYKKTSHQNEVLHVKFSTSLVGIYCAIMCDLVLVYSNLTWVWVRTWYCIRSSHQKVHIKNTSTSPTLYLQHYISYPTGYVNSSLLNMAHLVYRGYIPTYGGSYPLVNVYSLLLKMAHL